MLPDLQLYPPWIPLLLLDKKLDRGQGGHISCFVMEDKCQLKCSGSQEETSCLWKAKTRRDCLGHELCFVPLSNTPWSSEVWHWSGILRRHPEGSTALRSLSLHAQHKGHVWKQGKQSQQTSSPSFFGDPATHSCPAWRSSPGSLRDHTATYSTHAQEDGEMTSIVFYLYLL